MFFPPLRWLNFTSEGGEKLVYFFFYCEVKGKPVKDFSLKENLISSLHHTWVCLGFVWLFAWGLFVIGWFVFNYSFPLLKFKSGQGPHLHSARARGKGCQRKTK